MTPEPTSGRAPDAALNAEQVRWFQANYPPGHTVRVMADQIAALTAQCDEYRALALAAEGVLVDAPALAVKERERAEKAEQERDGFASTIAEIRASMKDDKALCASIRGALLAVQDAHLGVPTTHSAAKRVAGALVNVLDNIVLRHVNQESGHDIKTLCQEIWKLRHGGKPGENLDRKTGASRGRAFVNLEKAHIRVKADLTAAREALAASLEAAEMMAVVLERLGSKRSTDSDLRSGVDAHEAACALNRYRALAATRPDEPAGEGDR